LPALDVGASIIGPASGLTEDERKARIRNWCMVAGLVANTGLLCGFGALVSSTVSPGFMGWYISAGIACLAYTVLPIIHYFQTLKAMRVQCTMTLPF
jgi:hypothetical protein